MFQHTKCDGSKNLDNEWHKYDTQNILRVAMNTAQHLFLLSTKYATLKNIKKFNEPTPRSTVLLKKLIVARIVKKFPDFIEPEIYFLIHNNSLSCPRGVQNKRK
jgi:hypothetical protein